MFIAHLPAGYLLTRALQKKLRTEEYLWLGLAASIFPDIDLLYFYVIDNRQTDHHEYWTHTPIIWITLWIACLALSKITKKRELSGILSFTGPSSSRLESLCSHLFA